MPVRRPVSGDVNRHTARKEQPQRSSPPQGSRRAACDASRRTVDGLRTARHRAPASHLATAASFNAGTASSRRWPRNQRLLSRVAPPPPRCSTTPAFRHAPSIAPPPLPCPCPPRYATEAALLQDGRSGTAGRWVACQASCMTGQPCLAQDRTLDGHRAAAAVTGGAVRVDLRMMIGAWADDPRRGAVSAVLPPARLRQVAVLRDLFAGPPKSANRGGDR